MVQYTGVIGPAPSGGFRGAVPNPTKTSKNKPKPKPTPKGGGKKKGK